MTTIILLERMHRQFMEVVKVELDQMGIHDINNVQALILYNIGTEEMTVGELTLRGYYLGSNVSYNVKKMTENGFLKHERSPHDRRSVRVSLTERGLELRTKLEEMFERHLSAISSNIEINALNEANASLRLLEQFWLGQLGFGPRTGELPAFSAA